MAIEQEPILRENAQDTHPLSTAGLRSLTDGLIQSGQTTTYSEALLLVDPRLLPPALRRMTERRRERIEAETNASNKHTNGLTHEISPNGTHLEPNGTVALHPIETDHTNGNGHAGMNGLTAALGDIVITNGVLHDDETEPAQEPTQPEHPEQAIEQRNEPTTVRKTRLMQQVETMFADHAEPLHVFLGRVSVGRTYGELGRELGVSAQSVALWMKKYEIPYQPTGEKAEQFNTVETRINLHGVLEYKQDPIELYGIYGESNQASTAYNQARQTPQYLTAVRELFAQANEAESVIASTARTIQETRQAYERRLQEQIVRVAMHLTYKNMHSRRAPEYQQVWQGRANPQRYRELTMRKALELSKEHFGTELTPEQEAVLRERAGNLPDSLKKNELIAAIQNLLNQTSPNKKRDEARTARTTRLSRKKGAKEAAGMVAAVMMLPGTLYAVTREQTTPQPAQEIAMPKFNLDIRLDWHTPPSKLAQVVAREYGIEPTGANLEGITTMLTLRNFLDSLGDIPGGTKVRIPSRGEVKEFLKPI